MSSPWGRIRLRRPGLLAMLTLALALGCQGSVEDRLQEVRSLQELGAVEESLDELRGILKEFPDHGEANYLLGIAQLRLGQPTLAVWPLQLAERDPEFEVLAGLALASSYIRLDQIHVALETADRVLAAQPANLDERLAALRIRMIALMREERFDEALATADEVLEVEPNDLQVLALRANALLGADRVEEARDLLREMWESDAPGSEVGAAIAGVGLARLYADELEDALAAERQLAEVLGRFPADGSALRFAVEHYTDLDRPEPLKEILRGAVVAAPADLALRAWVAEQMALLGETDEAETLLEEATELDGTATSWLHLAEFRRKEGKIPEALEAVESALELTNPPPDVLRFWHADLVISNGDLERADGLVADLAGSSYQDMLKGRLALLRGQHQEALEFLTEALRRWPNNAGGRYLAAQAAYALGDVDRAISEFGEAFRIDQASTDAGFDLARLRLARGEPAQALVVAARMWAALQDTDDPRRVAALRLVAKAQIEGGDLEVAAKTLAALADLPGGEAPAAVERAALVARAKGPREAAALLAGAKLDLKDPENLEALRALAQYLVDERRFDDALARVNAAIDAHPEHGPFYDVRGRVQFEAGRIDDARSAFERALELEPDYEPALEGRAQVAMASGDLEGALAQFDRAAEAAPDNAGLAYGAASASMRRGDEPGAERRLRETLRRDPYHAGASNDLAWILAERGEDLDRALALAEQAVRQNRSAEFLDTLGWVRLKRGDAEAAVAPLERAHELAPDAQSIAYRLGQALIATGDTARARELLERAIESGDFPEAEKARQDLAALPPADS